MRAALEPFNRTGEIDPAFPAPEFEMRQASSIVDTAGVFRGRDALNDALRELQESFEEISFEAEEFRMSPDGRVVVSVHVRGRGRGSNIEIDNHIADVWTLREGQAVQLEVYEERTEPSKPSGSLAMRLNRAGSAPQEILRGDVGGQRQDHGSGDRGAQGAGC